MPQILGEENKIKEEESLVCVLSSVGVSKRGFLATRLKIVMSTEVLGSWSYQHYYVSLRISSCSSEP